MRCSTCGAILDRFDRYCGACDSPNLQGKLFPKFRSRQVDLELQGRLAEPDLPLKPGERPCPRCDTAAPRMERWCPSCGLDFDVVRPVRHHDPLTGVWRTPGPGNLDPFRSLGVLGVSFRVVLMLGGVLAGGIALLYLVWYQSLETALPRVSVDVALVSDWIGRLTVVSIGVSIVALLTAVAWTNRAYRNLPGLGVRGLRFSPEIVGAAWLVPGVNLVVPKLVLDELWRGSDPMTRSGTKRWRHQHAPTVAHIGWVALLAGVPAAAMVAFAAPLSANVPIGDLRLRLLLGVAANACLVLASSSLCIVIGQINERQADRAARLGPAEMVPLRDRRTGWTGSAGATGASRPAAFDCAEAGLLDRGPSPLRAMVAGRPVWGRY